MTELEETGFELLLSDPDIVAWLESEESDDGDEASSGS